MNYVCGVFIFAIYRWSRNSANKSLANINEFTVLPRTCQVLLTVNDHREMGGQLLLLAGQRLAHYVLACDPDTSVDRLSKCSPTLSTWLRGLVSNSRPQ